MKEIKLGNRVKDVYSGFEGIATGYSTYLYGCARVLVEPTELDKDGKLREAIWFDEQRIETVEELAPLKTTSGTNPGGPRPDAQRAKDPVR